MPEIDISKLTPEISEKYTVENNTFLATYNHLMYRILDIGVCGDFSIIKRVAPKGEVLKITGITPDGLLKRLYKTDYPLVELIGNGQSLMTDSPIEIESHKEPSEKSYGDVLVGGLGIGLFPTLIKDKPEVKSITIIEIAPEVIQLVYSQIKTAKMECINMDIFEYMKKCSKKFDFIYVDVCDGLVNPAKQRDEICLLAQPILKDGGICCVWLQKSYYKPKNIV